MMKILLSFMLTASMVFVSNFGFSVEHGTVEAIRPDENGGGWMTTEIATDDGNGWIIDDYVAPCGTNCIVIFDTNNTDIREDDTIRFIINISEF